MAGAFGFFTFTQPLHFPALGHSTISTTLDLYSHVTDTMQSDAAARLDAAFRLTINRAADGK